MNGKRRYVIYTQWNLLINKKKNEIMSLIANWMDQKNTVLNEMVEKNKYT